MRLLSLHANKSSFHTVHFNPTGVTIISALQSAPDSSDRSKTYNGVGKSLIIGLIHFCLGRDVKPAFEKALPGWEFTLKFSIDEITHEVSRKTDNQKIITFDGEEIPHKQFSRELGEMLFGKQVETVKYLTTSSLLGRFIRPSRKSYIDCRQIHDHDQPKTYRSLLANAYLLGLNIGLVSRKQELKIRKESSEQQLRSLQQNELFKKYFSAEKTAETLIKYRQTQINDIDRQLKNFNVAEDYHQIKIQSDETHRSLQRARNQYTLITNSLEQIKSSLKSRPDIEPSQVAKAYAEAKKELPDLVVNKIEDVFNFHKQLMKNRFARLSEESKRLQDEQQEVMERISILNQQSDQLLQYLNVHRALDEYVALTKRQADLQEELSRLINQRRLNEDLSREMRQLDRLHFDEIDRTNDYLENQSDWANELMDTFISFARRFYPNKPSGLVIENNDGINNGLRFDIKVDIQDDESEGIGNIKIFCYDMTLLKSALLSTEEHQNMNKVRFLFHDSRIFSGVDSRQAATLLEVALEQTAIDGTQYIATINDNTLRAVEEIWGKDQFEEFFNHHNTLVLTDESEETKLLGVEVDLEYE